MARKFFGIEKGLSFFTENGDIAAQVLFGNGLPGGDTGEQDAAPIGSLYLKLDGSGGQYKKVANAGAAADWEEVGNVSLDELSWRNETVVAATNDTLTAGSGYDLSAASDNEQGLDGNDVAVGQYILGDVDGTPALFEITAITSATDITLAAASQPLAANDTFVVQNYLPDSPAAQEAQAIVHSPDGTSIIKLADFNWALADGINLTGGYAAAAVAALVAAGDTVETAISKLDKLYQDLQTLSGVALGSTDLGTFTGSIIPDASTIKGALQSLETEIESLEAQVQLTGVVDTAQTLDSVLVDNVLACEWEVHIRSETTPANVQVLKINALHDGTGAADASNVDDSVFAKLKIGGNFSYAVSVDLNGTGALQEMRLRVLGAAGAAVTFTARRTIITG